MSLNKTIFRAGKKELPPLPRPYCSENERSQRRSLFSLKISELDHQWYPGLGGEKKPVCKLFANRLSLCNLFAITNQAFSLRQRLF